MPLESSLPALQPEHAAYARALAPYIAAMDELAREITLRIVFERVGGEIPRVGAVNRAVERLGRVIQTAQQTADLIGRRETLHAADVLAQGAPAGPGGVGAVQRAIPGLEAAQAPTALAAPGIPGDPLMAVGTAPGAPLPRVPFPEAVADVIAREPRLAASAAEVSQAYNESHAFALARSSSIKVTERVQKAVSTAIHQGRTVGEGARAIRQVARAAGEDMSRFTHAYAETVFRTNVSTAYSAGRFREMANPAVQFAIGALMFDGPTDSLPAGDSRPNHVAAVGLIASASDPVWSALAPPLGYNCRHRLSFVSWPELKRRRLLLPDGSVRKASIPPGAHADEGFQHTGRPDIAIYGGAV